VASPVAVEFVGQPCACGCDESLPTNTQSKKGFIHGHHMRLNPEGTARARAAVRWRPPTGPDSPLWRGGHSKESRAKFKASSCERCGFVAEHPQQLDVHRHRLPIEERETLCANCHRLVNVYEQLHGVREVSWRIAAPLSG
jgi:hypothetical protein